MNNQTYKLTFLPLFEQDLMEITNYITNILKNPSAAHNLVNEIELSILNRQKSPLAFEPYRTTKKREYPYYRINVRNYSIFYVVIDETMEVRRIIYSGRDLDKLL